MRDIIHSPLMKSTIISNDIPEDQNISSHLPVPNIDHFISCMFFRIIIIQFNIGEFFINSSLNIFVLYIASDFYDKSPPNSTIMHMSVSFHRTLGGMTQTRAFFNFTVLSTQEGDFCVWRAGLVAGYVPHMTFRGTTSSTAYQTCILIMSFCDTSQNHFKPCRSARARTRYVIALLHNAAHGYHTVIRRL